MVKEAGKVDLPGVELQVQALYPHYAYFGELSHSGDYIIIVLNCILSEIYCKHVFERVSAGSPLLYIFIYTLSHCWYKYLVKIE